MRRLGLLLVAFVLVGFTYGCLGSGGTQTSSSPTSSITTHQASPNSPSSTAAHQSNLTSSTQSNPTSSTAIHEFKKPSRMELIESLRGIRQFSFGDNASIMVNVTMEVENATKSGKVNTIYQRSGYVDLKERVAEVNTTMITFPGGTSVFTREVIVGNDVYLFIGGNWIKLTNESFGISPSIILNVTWQYNIVNFTLKYLKRKPYKEGFENGTYVLYYNVTTQDLKEMLWNMVRKNTNVSFNVTDGILELRFVGDKLVRGRVGYRMKVHLWGEEMGRRADIYEIGNVYDEFTLTSVNVKERVEVPKSYKA